MSKISYVRRLSFQASLRLYLKIFMCLHLLALFTAFVLPRFIRGSTEKRAATTNKTDDLTVEGSTSTDDSSKNVELVAADVKADVKAITTIRKQHLENRLEPDESSNSSSSCSSFNNSMNDISEKNRPRKADSNYLLKDLINKEVNKIKGETDNLSNLLMEKIEAANIEGLIDKTVSGIVELKDDLMRMNEPEVYSGGATDGLRKRNLTGNDLAAAASGKGGDGVDAFLKKEIDAIKEANVIPAVLSNGHAK